MTIAELYKYLDNAIPSSLSCSWDNDGLMCCPDPQKEVKKVLIALDITERAVGYAAENKFDAIISHHPMIFKKIGSIEPSFGCGRKSIELIKNGITAISFHTRLDALDGGVNDILCQKLELKNCTTFGPEGEKMGRIGTLEEPLSPEDFCDKIKSALNAPIVLCSSCGKAVRKIALLGGDGKDFVSSAIAEGADTYLSGRIGYNIVAEAPEMGINLIEAGHFYTEAPVCSFIESLVKSASSDIETEIFNSNEIKVI